MASSLHHFRSIGFSGAGFLTAYHLGVAECLIRNAILSSKGPSALTLTGVSGGALVSAAVSTGVAPEDGMEALLDISRCAQSNRLDTLTPGFSLIDHMEDVFSTLIKTALGGTQSNKLGDYDLNLLKKCCNNGKLRIGLTDRRVFPQIGYNPKGYRYVKDYRNVEDVVAACILSCYLPGITGPALGSQSSINKAVRRAQTRVSELVDTKSVVDFYGYPIPPIGDVSSREVFWDGGLVNMWPVIDDETLIVTPVSATFRSNPSISPSSSKAVKLPINPKTNVDVSIANFITMRRIAFSSDGKTLEHRFSQGYDDARAFLAEKSLVIYDDTVGLQRRAELRHLRE